MKLIKILFAFAVLAAGAAAFWWFVLCTSPAAVQEAIEQTHAAHPELEEELDDWSRTLNALATPFRAVGRLEGLVARVEQARTSEVDVAGVEIRPWQAVADRVPGAQLIEDAINSVGDVARLGGAVDAEFSALEEAADAYESARAAAAADASHANVVAACAAADTLSVELDAVAERIAPLGGALSEAHTQITAAQAWLGDVTPDGLQEGLVIGAIGTGLTAIETAVGVPNERVGETVANLRGYAETFRTIGALDDSMRPSLGGR